MKKTYNILDSFESELEDILDDEEETPTEVPTPTESDTVDVLEIPKYSDSNFDLQPTPPADHYEVPAKDTTQKIPHFAKSVQLYRRFKKLVSNLVSKNYDRLLEVIQETENRLQEQINKKGNSNYKTQPLIGGIVGSPNLNKDDIETIHRVGHMLFREVRVNKNETVMVDFIDYNNQFNKMAWDLVITNMTGMALLGFTVTAYFADEEVFYSVSNVTDNDNLDYEISVVKQNINMNLYFTNNSNTYLNIIYRRVY